RRPARPAGRGRRQLVTAPARGGRAPGPRISTSPGVDLETHIAGSGAPVTVFAHGLAGGIPDTRPLGSAVAGTRVFFQFRGHGRSDSPAGPWTFGALAADLAAVADSAAAPRAVGVSLGAGALCRLLAHAPT